MNKQNILDGYDMIRYASELDVQLNKNLKIYNKNENRWNKISTFLAVVG